jgi:hypothetical protein
MLFIIMYQKLLLILYNTSICEHEQCTQIEVDTLCKVNQKYTSA